MNSSVFYRRVKSPAFSAILGQREMTRAVVETIANEVSALSERTVQPDVVLVALPIVRDQRRLRLLDVGCGTGRFLNFVKQCWARLPCIGLDMSEPYLREARRHLNGRSWLKLVAGNREMDAYTEAVTNVFMVHELPSKVRRAMFANRGTISKGRARTAGGLGVRQAPGHIWPPH